MVWIHLVILLSILQLIVFMVLVGRARKKFGVKPPAISGEENFERYYRVQMNTIEMLVMFIPSILLASTYWSPYLMAVLGFSYLIGRVFYFQAYVNSKERTIPFIMGVVPISLFIVLGIAGTIRALL
ncbi:MAG: MAPEG family protein [Bacteriovorax sp.]|nr:MAPEG family protein [Bacteriovorax sp.]